jgi:hypothetical protein
MSAAIVPTRGVAVELDRTRYFRFSLSVLRKLQSGESRDLSLGHFFLLGLQGDDPDLTLEKVEELIDLENVKELCEPLKRASGGLIDLSRLFPQMFPQTPPPSPANGGGVSA